MTAWRFRSSMNFFVLFSFNSRMRLTSAHRHSGTSAGFRSGGINAPLPPEAKKLLKI